MRLVLASASPRRAELLRSARFDFDIMSADVDETPRPGESADAYTLRVAREKARAVSVRLRDAQAAVIGADTEVVVGGRILGKPLGDAHASEMLQQLSAAAHDVLTAVVICGFTREISDIAKTRVYFSAMSGEEIRDYVATGEPMGKAGAYAIQGYAARFVERIEGSWSNVVGLPVHTVHQLMRRLAAGGGTSVT